MGIMIIFAKAKSYLVVSTLFLKFIYAHHMDTMQKQSCSSMPYVCCVDAYDTFTQPGVSCSYNKMWHHPEPHDCHA